MLTQNGYFILAAMIEITRMNQSCSHCQALVILRELIFFYSDMPIQRHDCENSVFLPAEQLSKTSGGVVRRHCRSCKLTVYMPKMNRISASLRFIRPNCTPPLPAHPLWRLPGWLNITLAICIRLLIGAAGFQLQPTFLVTLKVALYIITLGIDR